MSVTRDDARPIEFVPDADDIRCAEKAELFRCGDDVHITLSGDGGETVSISPRVARLILDITGALKDGGGVAVLPVESLLTAQEVADLLRVSRPHATRLMDGGAIPFTTTPGGHRRVRAGDLTAYIKEREPIDRARAARRKEALQGLADQAQELGMGY